ncbi:MAG: SDR family oxidoreductase, partial [Puniceicoccales bacterium]|nr:SDR family oxidoreductase [Puniceicoccales bacterium]
MDFLDFEGKIFLIMGVANRKSVAWAIAQSLEKLGAQVIYSVRSTKRLESLGELLGDREIYICDVENADEVQQLATSIGKKHPQINGFVHSIAFANYGEGSRPFHETKRQDFLQATTISCFSLVEIANALKNILTRDASVVTIGISSQVAAATYG